MNNSKIVVLVITTVMISAFLAAPAIALECGNVGTDWITQPDDTTDANSTACGDGAVAGGDNSTAIGYQSSSPGTSSVAFGPSSYASGGYAVALGFSASAQTQETIGIGGYADAAGWRSIAIGGRTETLARYDIALGAYAFAHGDAATAIGYRAYADQSYSMVLGSIKGVNTAPAYTDVAIGTTAPLAPLHVHRDDGTAEIMVEETSAVVGPRTLFTLANPGNTKFEIMNTDAMNSWAFTNSGSDFRVSLQGSGVVEFRVDNAGNAFVANDLEVGGTVTTNLNMPSDAALKQNIEALDPQDVLEKVTALPVQSWEYNKTPGVRHIGPMAQDFKAAFGLGDNRTAISVVDASGVALASIQALNQKLESRNAQLDRKVVELARRNAALEDELAAIRGEMKAVLLLLSPAVSHN